MRGLWLLLIPVWGCATSGDIATNGPQAFGGSGGEAGADAGGSGHSGGSGGGSSTAWGGSAGAGAASVGGSQSVGGSGGGSAGMSSGGAASGGNPSGGSGGNCECQPNEQQQDDCGNCGKRVRTCGQDCLWGAWGSCGGEGPCAPGATQAGGCDSCSQQVCQNDCSWGGCELKPGNECDWDTGHNWRCCAVDSWHFCLSSCKWSTACEYNLANANCCSGSGPRC